MAEEDNWKPVHDLAVKHVTYDRWKKRLGYDEMDDWFEEQQNPILEEVIKKCKPFVRKIANQMTYGDGWACSLKGGRQILSLKKYGLHPDDIIRHGYLSIMRALKNYKPSKGRITTFLSNTIAGWMYHKALDEKEFIPINPLYRTIINRTFRKYEEDRINDIIDGTDSNQDPILKIAEELNCSVESARTLCQSYFCRMREWDGPVSRKKDYRSSKTTYGDIYADTSHESDTPETAIQDAQLHATIMKHIGRLKTDREKTIIIRRNGLDGFPPDTLDDLGKEYGISRQRVNVIEKKAYSQITEWIKNDPHLKQYADDMDTFDPNIAKDTISGNKYLNQYMN